MRAGMRRATVGGPLGDSEWARVPTPSGHQHTFHELLREELQGRREQISRWEWVWETHGTPDQISMTRAMQG